MKTGTVIVKAGQPASLVDEEVIPFVLTGGNGESVAQTVGVGLTLSVTPAILGQSEDIEMDIKLKQVNKTGQSGSVPTTATHEVNTRLFVKSND